MRLVEGEIVHIETTYGSIIEGEIFNIYNFINDGKKQTTIIIKSKERLTKVNLASIVEFHVLDSKKSITITHDKFCKVVGRLLADIKTTRQTECEEDEVDVLVNVLTEFSAAIATELFKGNGDDD